MSFQYTINVETCKIYNKAIEFLALQHKFAIASTEAKRAKPPPGPEPHQSKFTACEIPTYQKRRTNGANEPHCKKRLICKDPEFGAKSSCHIKFKHECLGLLGQPIRWSSKFNQVKKKKWREQTTIYKLKDEDVGIVFCHDKLTSVEVKHLFLHRCAFKIPMSSSEIVAPKLHNFIVDTWQSSWHTTQSTMSQWLEISMAVPIQTGNHVVADAISSANKQKINQISPNKHLWACWLEFMAVIILQRYGVGVSHSPL